MSCYLDGILLASWSLGFIIIVPDIGYFENHVGLKSINQTRDYGAKLSNVAPACDDRWMSALRSTVHNDRPKGCSRSTNEAKKFDNVAEIRYWAHIL